MVKVEVVTSAVSSLEVATLSEVMTSKAWAEVVAWVASITMAPF